MNIREELSNQGWTFNQAILAVCYSVALTVGLSLLIIYGGQ